MGQQQASSGRIRQVPNMERELIAAMFGWFRPKIVIATTSALTDSRLLQLPVNGIILDESAQCRFHDFCAAISLLGRVNSTPSTNN